MLYIIKWKEVISCLIQVACWPPKDQYYNNKLMLTFPEVSYCNEKSPQNFGGFFFMVIIFLHYALFISLIQNI